MDSQSGKTKSDLECMLCDETAEPKALPLTLLREITDGFSYKQEIGSGGFAVVYKGKLENGTVAVKKLSNTLMSEKEFHREVECLMVVKHENVVRFLGYCSDTQGTMVRYNGKLVMADIQQRLLCFEYLPKGSLDQYITDASTGLEWRNRYQVIKGICKGLQHLHHKNIVHLDLKPANILLDDNMVPKITDFGLSRCFDEMQSRAITVKIGGTLGYLAPEFGNGEISYRFDFYSLGVIIIEILTGKKGYYAVENVLESWNKRLEKSQIDKQLRQVRVCAEIGSECTDFNPSKRPDTVQHIIDRLNETESMDGYTETGITASHAQNSPSELHQDTFKAAGETSSEVPKSWSNRLEKSQSHKQPGQVRVCAEVGAECTDFNPSKRPDTQHMVETLNEIENTDGYIKTGIITSHEPMDEIQCPGVVVEHAQNAPNELHLDTPKAVGETSSKDFSFSWPTNLFMDQRQPGIQAQMSEAVLPVLTEICAILGVEATMAIIANISKKQDPSSVVGHFGPEHFTLDTLRTATEGFNDGRRIGSGTFGSVYRGTLPDGCEVAIKRAEDHAKSSSSAAHRNDRDTAFNSELLALARANHRNIVCLLGCCTESDERVLVYEFMANGTLHDQLHDRSPMAAPVLSWCGRLAITLDAARGIEYMHVYSVPPIIHRDVKSAIILLDDSWTAKIADFGLSSVLDHNNNNGNRNLQHQQRLLGTEGYIDPGYYELQQLLQRQHLLQQQQLLLDKSDVYSFGVVLLELISGCRVVQQYAENVTPKNIVEFTVPHILADDVARVLDSRLPTPTPAEAEALAYIGYLAADCVGPIGCDRPSMTEVVDALERALAACSTAPVQR